MILKNKAGTNNGFYLLHVMVHTNREAASKIMSQLGTQKGGVHTERPLGLDA